MFLHLHATAQWIRHQTLNLEVLYSTPGVSTGVSYDVAIPNKNIMKLAISLPNVHTDFKLYTSTGTVFFLPQMVNFKHKSAFNGILPFALFRTSSTSLILYKKGLSCDITSHIHSLPMKYLSTADYCNVRNYFIFDNMSLYNSTHFEMLFKHRLFHCGR